MRLILLLSCCLLPAAVFGAPKNLDVDSLQTQLELVKTDSEKAAIYIDLIEQFRRTNISRANFFAGEAQQLTEHIDDLFVKAKLNLTLGTLQFHEGNYRLAADYYLRSRNYFELHADTSTYFSSIVNNNLGLVYERLGASQKAEPFFHEAIQLLKSAEDGVNLEMLAKLYLNLGASLRGQGKAEDALASYEKSASISRTNDFHLLLANNLHNIGNHYVTLGDYDKAFEYLNDALKIKREQGQLFTLPTTLLILGHCYLQRGEESKAFECLKEAQQISESLGMKYEMRAIYDEWVGIAAAQGNYEEAFHQLTRFNELDAQIKGDERSQKINALVQEYEFRQQQQATAAAHQAYLYRLYFGGVIIVLVLALLLVLYLYQRKKTKLALLDKEHSDWLHQQAEENNQKLLQDIEHKNKELTTNVMNLLQKNELINKVSEDLLQLQRKANKVEQKEIRNIIYQLQSSSSDDLWQSFEVHFQQVHVGFYEDLARKYPDLSNNERKLCAFLKLNMSSKDISAITHQSPKSIDMARFRLRKKLGVSGADVDLCQLMNEVG